MRMLKCAAVALLVGVQPAFGQERGGDPIEIPLRMEQGRLVVTVDGPNGESYDFGLALGMSFLGESFVAEVGAPEVNWPDGLTLPIRLREPVACLRVGQDFPPVAADGTVLAGYSYTPHPAGGGFLPVLGPHGLAWSSG